MTKEALRKIREDRGLTRQQFADMLGGIGAGAVVQWEGGNRKIPAWVEEKIFRTTEISFPLPLLKDLIDIAITEDTSFEQLLSEAVRDYLAARRNKPLDTLKSSQAAAAALASSVLMEQPITYHTDCQTEQPPNPSNSP